MSVAVYDCSVYEVAFYLCGVYECSVFLDTLFFGILLSIFSFVVKIWYILSFQKNLFLTFASQIFTLAEEV